jgi:hypothetical protein
MRRDELARLGVQLPVLPVIVLGGLPGEPDWAPRLERIGLDVVCSGAAADTPETWEAARSAVPHRPVKAVAGDAAALVSAGCVIVEGDDSAGGYAFGPFDGVIVPVDGEAAEIEQPDDVSAHIVVALRDAEPADVWIAAGGLVAVAPEVAVAKLEALTEGTRRARLYLAKRQFEIDD